MKLDIDKDKQKRMVRDILMQFNGSALHPAELVLALSEALGRVIAQVEGSDMAKQELTELAIKHMATAIEYSKPRIFVQ